MTHIAAIAVSIAKALKTDDVVYLADDDQQADALAAALRAIAPAHGVVFLPSSDALPGDVAPASPANSGSRVAALRQLRADQQVPERARLACILSGEAAARRYPSAESFDAALPRLFIGDTIVVAEIAEQLESLGYFADDRVDEPGEMAIRGEVIDLFPADSATPARIELADQKIVSIRSYDPLTQRTVDNLEALEIGRASEPPIDQPNSVLAHLQSGLFGVSEKAMSRRRRFVLLASDAAASGDWIDAIDDAAWRAAQEAWRPLDVPTGVEAVPRFAEARAPLAALGRFAKPLLEDDRRFVLAGGTRDVRFLRGKVGKRLGQELPLLSSWDEILALAPGAAAAIVMPVDRGYVDDTHVVVAAADLLGSRAVLEALPATSVNPLVSGAGDVRIGDVIVHEDHGIAVVAGLELGPLGDDGAVEMIALEYANGARRLVPLDETDRIWRYGADPDAVALDKLDGSSWTKRRVAIDASITETARALTDLAKSRQTLTAPVIDPDSALYERIAGSFAFNETADQARAIGAVRDDLARGKPMDRLVIGDVGYGKTEVALRAAALAALAGYQVVIAAPTTVLVRQHLESFKRRFDSAGIKVEGLSRLSSASEKKAVKAGLADGSVDIVIGTGGVMSKSVAYAKLGLIIIDEEQRFGAADKARLRGSGDRHLLTLSATPIPRTLQMALIGLQQISVIATPPARRQPIRTSLDQFDTGRIRTALMREKTRGGQSFVVVPRIDDMAELYEKLGRIAPELEIVQAHGKLPAAEIDQVMVDFAGGKGDVLLATNIIEAGLDVPRANTMMVWRADRFGLAQLHQLRGRVGRGNRRGQVILLTQDLDAMGERTLKRLRTLATFDRLGAGFEISAQDLDMRGAGDIIGETQAGHMKLIGIDLYQHLLETALRRLRGEDVERWAPELNVGSPGALPVDWIPEADIRLTLYVQLARLTDAGAIDAFEAELVDRFGPLPAEAETLLARARVRMSARAARVRRIDAGPAAIALTVHTNFSGDIEKSGLTKKGDRFLLMEPTEESERMSRVQALLEELAD